MISILESDGYFPAVAERWYTLAQESIRLRGRFDVALSGGRTPEGLLRQLRSHIPLQALWPSIHFWFGDERAVPPDHADSNFRMAQNALLAHIQAGGIQRMLGEQAPQEAVQHYQQALAVLREEHGLPCFDLVMLGVGNDGHIASLFPASTNLYERKQSVVAAYIPAVSSWRISLTMPVIQHARHIMVLVKGEEKQPMMHKLLVERLAGLPASEIAGLSQVEWWLDRPASGQIRPVG